MRWAAHTLKGNSELVGGVYLAKLCKQLETLVDYGETGEVLEYVSRIEAEFEVVKSNLLNKIDQN